MAKHKTITVTIRNYETYKGRSDVKQNSWFRCSNRIFEDPDFFDFSFEEIAVWLYILSLSSQKNSATVTINLGHAERVCRLKSAVVMSAIAKLEGNQIHPVHDTSTLRARTADVTFTCATEQYNTEQTEQTRQDTPAPPDFDFESLYRSYARRKGKDEGMQRLRSRIKTQEQFDQFARAVRKHASECRRLRTDEKYIPYWSSFVGVPGKEPWRDYIDDSPPKPAPPPPQPEPIAEPPPEPLDLSTIGNRWCKEAVAKLRLPIKEVGA